MRVAATGLLLAAVVAFAVAGCGGGGSESGGSTAETHAMSTTTASGDAAKGKEVFDANGCASCHTLAAAGAGGQVGPDLDKQLADDAQRAGKPLPEFTRESIVDPNAYIAKGYSKGIMPEVFGDQLSKQEISDLVAFVDQSVNG